MIVKALLIKKAACVALVLGTAIVDGKLTNRTVHQGGRELNPIMRPLAGSTAVYVPGIAQASAAAILEITRPKSKATTFFIGTAVAGHSAGIACNLRSLSDKPTYEGKELSRDNR